MVQERDVRVEMRNMIETHCMEAMQLSPGLVWSNARDTMVREYGEVAGLRFFNKSEAINLIKRIRNEATGGDVLRAIEDEPARFVSKEDSRAFLQFNTGYSLAKAYRRIIGFAHPDLMRLMRYDGVTLFIDATFKVTPKPFYQTLIVMVYDRAHDLYLPCFYILMEAKDHWAYYHALQWIKVQCDQKCVPAVVVCDFESALQKAVRDHFPSCYIVGCLFHWKQAIRKKMVSLRIPASQIKVAMEPGSVDLLTVIPKDDIQIKGIPFVTNILYTKIDRLGHKTKWDQFWRYFTATWIKLHKPSCWNISAMMESQVAIVNRTNNPLEAYNRALADRLGTIHPGMLTFVEAIKQESIRYLSILEDVRYECGANSRSPMH
ncbi:hypothetical protein BBJ28_00025031 [Nothophytophthora sp. Chile5]|nr:hypothetical protein BBJ28_00025031 [Nothophytophthora sp. Chile5]